MTKFSLFITVFLLMHFGSLSNEPDSVYLFSYTKVFPHASSFDLVDWGYLQENDTKLGVGRWIQYYRYSPCRSAILSGASC